MKTLYDTLFFYAAEERTDRFLRKDRKELLAELDMVNHALDELRATGDKGADLAGRIESGTDTAALFKERAAFLAGLSMGLELGALGR